MTRRILEKKEIRNAGWIIGGRIARMLFSLIVSVLSARALGPNNYGLVNYGLVYVSFFVSLSNLGIDSIILKDFADNPDDEGKTLGTTIILQIISSILSIVLIACISLLLDNNEPIAVTVVTLSSISLIFQAFGTIEYYFQYRYLSKIPALTGFFAYAAASIYKIVLLLLGCSIQLFALSTAFDHFILSILLFIIYRKKHGPKLHFSPDKAKNLLSISYHYILSNTMIAIYSQIDKLMLKQLIGNSALGYYSTAASISNMWVFILSALIVSMRPTIFRLHKTDHNAYLQKNRTLYAIIFYLSLTVSIVIAVCSRFIIGILYGNIYMPASSVLSVLTCLTAFSYLGAARNIWVVCEGKQMYLKYIYFSAIIINIALNSIMIPKTGAFGAALASLATQIFTSLLIPLMIPGMRPNVRLMLEAVMLKGIIPASDKKA